MKLLSYLYIFKFSSVVILLRHFSLKFLFVNYITVSVLKFDLLEFIKCPIICDIVITFILSNFYSPITLLSVL